MDSPILLWFRRDLRLQDHAPLSAAIAEDRPIIPCFIDDPSEGIGGATRWWRDRSLQQLSLALEKRHSRLIIRKGTFAEQLTRLAKETKATDIYTHRRYYNIEQEKEIAEKLSQKEIRIRGFAGDYLLEPHTVKNNQGNAFQVFAPFWRYLQSKYIVPAALPAPSTWRSPTTWPSSLPLPLFSPFWAENFRNFCEPGEDRAHEKLFHFRKNALHLYRLERDRPDLEKTSKLSLHLAYGEISPHAIWRAIAGHAGEEAFLRQLAWRDFHAQLFFRFDDLRNRVFSPRFQNFPYQQDEKALHAWQYGQTGYPLVDAGMRELWQTGYMHNRVRMVVASFLTKHLLIDWRHGEKWFWDQLMDADPAQNSGNWQWVAGSGADAAPYFRIFHPVRQSQNFDPDGIYLKRWLPELRDLSPKEIHTPWFFPDKKGHYPDPIIDHAFARQRALDIFQSMKSKSGA